MGPHFASLVAVQTEDEGKSIGQAITEDYRARGESARDARSHRRFFLVKYPEWSASADPGATKFRHGVAWRAGAGAH